MKRFNFISLLSEFSNAFFGNQVLFFFSLVSLMDQYNSFQTHIYRKNKNLEKRPRECEERMLDTKYKCVSKRKPRLKTKTTEQSNRTSASTESREEGKKTQVTFRAKHTRMKRTTLTRRTSKKTQKLISIAMVTDNDRLLQRQ